MKISLIAAMGRDRVIGKGGAMPWHLPADLAHFKTLTMGKPMIMGRTTFQAIGRALPGRDNIVVTRDQQFDAQGCIVVHDIDAAIAAAGDASELMVIGGAKLYGQFIDRADHLYLTLIEEKFAGDTFFPEYTRADWEGVSRENHDADGKNPHAYTFLHLRRKRD